MISRIQNVSSNSPPVQEACITTLHKLCSNVLANPTEEKFRKVRANNSMMKGKVSACRGGEEFLIAAGWRRKVENFEPYFVFPDAAASFGGGGGAADNAENPKSIGRDILNNDNNNINKGSHQLLIDVLHLAEEVLNKNLTLAREKTERHERQKFLEKNDAAMRKEQTMQAIKEDKERRKLSTTTTTTMHKKQKNTATQE